MRFVSRTALLALAAGAVVAADAAAQDGRALYHGKANCFTCHGREGAGTPLGPALNDTAWLNIDGSVAAIRTVVRDGVSKPKRYPAPMPPLGGAKLSAAELEAVVAYVHSLSRRDDVTAPPPAPAPPSGRQ